MHAAHSDTASASLAGATLVITRPAGTSAAFAAQARRLGADTVIVPGLSLRAAPDAANTRAALSAARGAWMWIFTSPAAVRFAFHSVPDLDIAAPAKAICVGPGTARALAHRGVHAVIPHASMDSAGLLALPELVDVRGRRVVLVCAPNGRDMISVELQRRGAAVDVIHVYQRVAPRLTRHHFKALENACEPLIALLSSGTALAHLVALLPPPLLQRLCGQTLIVSSARLAALARQSGFENIVEAASAMSDDLLDAAAKALARHRL